jgi:hypothetical protein
VWGGSLIWTSDRAYLAGGESIPLYMYMVNRITVSTSSLNVMLQLNMVVTMHMCSNSATLHLLLLFEPRTTNCFSLRDPTNTIILYDDWCVYCRNFESVLQSTIPGCVLPFSIAHETAYRSPFHAMRPYAHSLSLNINYAMWDDNIVLRFCFVPIHVKNHEKEGNVSKT